MKRGVIIGLLALSAVGNAMLLSSLPRKVKSSRPSSTGESAGSVVGQLKIPAWNDVASTDASALQNALQQAGLPSEFARVVAIAQINQPFSERRRQLQETTKAPYWLPSYYTNTAGGAEMRALSREQQRAIEATLPFDPSDLSPGALASLRQRFGPIPMEKALRLQAIEQDYSDLTLSVHGEAASFPLAEDRAKLALLEKEKRRDLRTVFTPEELEEYQLRNSSVADLLRRQIQFVEVSETEFRQLYRLQQAFEDQYGPRPPRSAGRPAQFNSSPRSRRSSPK